VTETIALTNVGNDKIEAWAEILEETFDRIDLFVINGAWGGRLYLPDSVLVVDDTHVKIPVRIAWRGEVPRDRAGDYNSAIEWIREQVSP
jgi:hypothetical protein